MGIHPDGQGGRYSSSDDIPNRSMKRTDHSEPWTIRQPERLVQLEVHRLLASLLDRDVGRIEVGPIPVVQDRI